MQYNQPYGVSDPQAPYINGNPTTGQMGSIPPAASIEFPQRELVSMISATGLLPNNSDLAQLLKSIKLVDVMNWFKMGENQGTANQWSMACPALPIMPPPKGTTVWFKAGTPSISGGTVFSLNGSAFSPVVCCDLSPIAIGDIPATAWLLLYNDGTNWQVVAGSTRQFGTLPLLTKVTDWYVNIATGDDTNFDGTTPAFTTGKHGPFKTPQRAALEVLKYNQNGYDQNVHVADGSYASFFTYPNNGSGYVNFIGNESFPQNCAVSTAIADTCAIFDTGGFHRFKGFRLSATGSGVADGFANNSSNSVLSNCRFRTMRPRYHMSAAWNGYLLLSGGTITIEQNATTQIHMTADLNSQIARDPFNLPALNILGPVNIGIFVEGNQLGVAQVVYSSITGKANVHGSQFNAVGNGVVCSVGAGPNYFPGDSAGTLSFGGQYIPRDSSQWRSSLSFPISRAIGIGSSGPTPRTSGRAPGRRSCRSPIRPMWRGSIG